MFFGSVGKVPPNVVSGHDGCFPRRCGPGVILAVENVLKPQRARNVRCLSTIEWLAPHWSGWRNRLTCPEGLGVRFV